MTIEELIAIATGEAQQALDTARKEIAKVVEEKTADSVERFFDDGTGCWYRKENDKWVKE